MKISQERLKQIIKEEMELQDQYMDHVDNEGNMARRQLEQLAEYSMEFAGMLEDNTQLEAWVQSKITLAQDYISKVKHYLEDELGMKQGCGGNAVPLDNQVYEIDDEDAYLMET